MTAPTRPHRNHVARSSLPLSTLLLTFAGASPRPEPQPSVRSLTTTPRHHTITRGPRAIALATLTCTLLVLGNAGSQAGVGRTTTS